MEVGKIRIDKFLKNSRIIKRRTMAREACQQGRIQINEKTAKPADNVQVGDRVSISFGNKEVNIEILKIEDNVAKSEAVNLYREI